MSATKCGILIACREQRFAACQHAMLPEPREFIELRFIKNRAGCKITNRACAALQRICCHPNALAEAASAAQPRSHDPIADKKEETREGALTLPPGKLHEGLQEYRYCACLTVIES